jgi:hypothetical protein
MGLGGTHFYCGSHWTLRGCAFQLNRNAIAVRFNRGREDLGSTGGERRTIRVSGRTPLRTFSAAGHK